MRTLKEALISKDKRDWASVRDQILYDDAKNYYVIFVFTGSTKEEIFKKFPESEFFVKTQRAKTKFGIPILKKTIVTKNMKWFQDLADKNKDIISFSNIRREKTIQEFINKVNSKEATHEIGNLVDLEYEIKWSK